MFTLPPRKPNRACADCVAVPTVILIAPTVVIAIKRIIAIVFVCIIGLN